MASAEKPWLVKHPTEWRQIGIVATYLGLLASMVFVPACRNVGMRRDDRWQSFVKLRGARVQLDHVQQRLPHDPSQSRGAALVRAPRTTREGSGGAHRSFAR